MFNAETLVDVIRNALIETEMDTMRSVAEQLRKVPASMPMSEVADMLDAAVDEMAEVVATRVTVRPVPAGTEHPGPVSPANVGLITHAQASKLASIMADTGHAIATLAMERGHAPIVVRVDVGTEARVFHVQRDGRTVEFGAEGPEAA